MDAENENQNEGLRAYCVCYASCPELRRGCSHESQCWVLKELREQNTPEKRKAAGEEYRRSLGAQEKTGELPLSNVLHRLTRADVPGAALTVAQHPDNKPAYVAAREWWRGNKTLLPALVLAGPNGCGKTVAAAWCSLEWGKRYPWAQPTGNTVRPLVWLDGRALSRIGNMGAEAARELDDAERCGMLVVDDAAREGNRPSIEALSDVLMARLDHRRLTILTTNVTGESFRVRYGNSLADRLKANAAAPNLSRETSQRARPQ